MHTFILISHVLINNYVIIRFVPYEPLLYHYINLNRTFSLVNAFIIQSFITYLP